MLRVLYYVTFISDLVSFRLPDRPYGLAYDHKSGFVFVAQSIINNVIAVDVTTGAVVRTIGKGRGKGFGELDNPRDVALDLFGNLLVAERDNERIAVFNASNGTPIASFNMSRSRSVLVDKNGSVIVGASDGLLMWSY